MAIIFTIVKFFDSSLTVHFP